MTTAVRFVITGPANVDFCIDEIAGARLTTVRSEEIQKAQKKAPYVFRWGSEWKTLEIDIVHFYKSTRAKIDQIVNSRAEMTVFYAYRDFTTTLSLTCILDPSEVVEFYTLGKEKAKVVTTFKLLQSS